VFAPRARRAVKPHSRFRALRNRNYRRFFVGQMVSQGGTFMQVVAQAWLVLQLTKSGTALGLLSTLQFLPMLVLGGPAGVLVDRYDHRRLYVVTQALAGVCALALGLIVAAGVTQLWMVYVLAILTGLISTVDQPVRQSLIFDLVGHDDLADAVSLTFGLSNASRVIGPTIAGLLIALVGIAPCFFVNAASFGAVIVALLMMDPAKMYSVPAQPQEKGQFRAGLRYVRGSPDLLSLLVLSAFLYGFAWEFDVVLPIVAKETFDGGAALYGFMNGVVGMGCVVGAIVIAGKFAQTNRLLIGAVFVFSGAYLVAAVAPSLVLLFPVLFVLGCAISTAGASLSARVQLGSASEMRGRVSALYGLTVLGTRPVCAPILGATAEQAGAAWMMALPGIAMLAVAVPSWCRIHRRIPAGAPDEAWPRSDDVFQAGAVDNGRWRRGRADRARAGASVVGTGEAGVGHGEVHDLVGPDAELAE
jgi:MFS family permease